MTRHVSGHASWASRPSSTASAGFDSSMTAAISAPDGRHPGEHVERDLEPVGQRRRAERARAGVSVDVARR